jgi:hypothetical protein
MMSRLEKIEAVTDGVGHGGVVVDVRELRRLIVVAWAAKTLVKLYDDCPTPRLALDVAVGALREFVGPLVEE